MVFLQGLGITRREIEQTSQSDVLSIYIYIYRSIARNRLTEAVDLVHRRKMEDMPGPFFLN